MIIVSACLAGINCRYDGTNGKISEIEEMVLAGKALPLCPEVLGGLEIPRPPCEIIRSGSDFRVVNIKNEDQTRFFQIGADKTLKMAILTGAATAILKSRSPSCGQGRVYDGSFSGKLTEGNGLTAELLIKHGIKILTEENFKTFL